MTTFSASFEGGYTDGQLLTTTQVGSDTPFAEFRDSTRGTGGGGTITATSVNAVKGTRCMAITPDSTTASLLTNVWWYPSSNGNAFSAYVLLSGSPSTTCHFIRDTNQSGAPSAVVAVSAARNLLIYDAANALKATSSAALTVGTWYRIEGQLQNGTGSTDTFNVQLFASNSTTPLWSSGAITGNFGTTVLNRWAIGKMSSCTWAPIYVDDPRLVDTTTTALGPTAGGIGVPTLTLPADDTIQVNSGTHTYTASATAASGGAITAYRWTQKSGPAVTLTGASTATVSFTAPAAAGDIVLHCDVDQTG